MNGSVVLSAIKIVIPLALFIIAVSSKRITAIAVNTIREELRKKSLYFILIFGIFFILLSGFVSRYQPGREEESMVQLGLFVIGLFGMLMTIFSATTILYYEIKNKTIFLLFSNPIWSLHIIVGKFLGILFIIFVAVFIMGGCLLLYLLIRGSFDIKVLEAIILVFFQLMMLNALCCLGATFLSRITNIILSLLLFFLGSVQSTLKDLLTVITVPFIKFYLKIFLYILPNFEQFAVRERMFDRDFLFNPIYCFHSIGDAFYRAAILVLIGILFFHVREVGSQEWA